jgi:multidrug resistance efflux pump
MKRSFYSILIASILVALLVACGPGAAGQETAESQPEMLIAEGRLTPLNALDLSFQVSGQVDEVLVEDGDKVSRKQVLATLVDSAELHAALARAEEEALTAEQDLEDYETSGDLHLAQGTLDMITARNKYKTARNNFLSGRSTERQARMDEAAANLRIAEERLQRLEDNDGLDPVEMEALQARADAAQTAVESAQQAIDALSLTASIRGSVADIRIQPGQQVAVGEVVMALADYSEWVVKTDSLTEKEVVDVAVGQEVEVILDALPDITLSGVVANINSRYEEKRGDITYTVTVSLTQTDPQMLWGMTAAIYFKPIE